MAVLTYWIAHRFPALSHNARIAAYELFCSGVVLFVWTAIVTKTLEQRRPVLIGAAFVLIVLGMLAVDLANPRLPY